MNESFRRQSGKWGSEEAQHYVSAETKDDNCWFEKNSETDYEKVPRSDWDSVKVASSSDSTMPIQAFNSKSSSGFSSRLSSHEDRREQNVKNLNGDNNDIVQVSRKRGGDPGYNTSMFPSRFDRGHQNHSRSPKGSWSRSHRSRSRTPPSSFRDELDEYNGRTGRRSQGRVLPRDEFMSERVNQEYEAKRYFQPQRDQSRDRVTRRYDAYYDDDRESDEDPRSNRSASLRGQLIRGSSYRDDHHNAFVEIHGREISEIHDAERYESFGRDRSENHGRERYRNQGKDRSESHGRERYESIDRERSENHGREKSDDNRDTHLSFKQEHGRDGPGRSYGTPCKFFLSGNCRNGENCRFSHESVTHDSADARFGSSTQQSNMGNGSRSGGGPRWKDISPDPANNAWEGAMNERKSHNLTDQNRSRRWSKGRNNDMETTEGSSMRSSVDNGRDRSQGWAKRVDGSPEAANDTSLRNSADGKRDRSDRWQKWKGSISEAAGRSQGWPELGNTTSEVAGQDGPQAWPEWGGDVSDAAGQGSQGWPKGVEDASEAQSDGQDKYANSNNPWEDSKYSCKAPEPARMILPEKESLDDKQSKNWGDCNPWEDSNFSWKAPESAQMILTEKESLGDKQSKTWGGDELFLGDSGLNTTDTIPEAMLVDVESDDKPFVEVSGPSEWIEKKNVSIIVFESHVDGNRLSVANMSPAGITTEQFHHFIDISDNGKVNQGSQSRSSVDMSTSVICQSNIIQEAFPCNDRDDANISSIPVDVNSSILGESVVSEYPSAPHGYNQNHQEKDFSSFGSGGQGFDLNEPIQQIIHQSSSNSHHEVYTHLGEPFESEKLQITNKKETTQSSVTSRPVENLNSSNSLTQNLQKLYPTLYSPNIKVSVPPSLTFAEEVASVHNSIRHGDANGDTTMVALPETLIQQSSFPKKVVEQNNNTVQESQTQNLPLYSDSNETVAPVSSMYEDQYSPIINSIDFASSVVNNHPSEFLKNPVEQHKNVVLTSDSMDLTQFSCQSSKKLQEQVKTNMLEPETMLKNVKSSSIAEGNSFKNGNMHGVFTQVNFESKPTEPIVGEKLVSRVTRVPNIAQSVNGDGQGGEDSMKGKESKALRNFKFALAEFAKELLKPAWKDGQVSKEAHKIIVKKVVDKVCNTVQGDHIPQTAEKIDFYLTFSKPKLAKLVQAYVERGKQLKA